MDEPAKPQMPVMRIFTLVKMFEQNILKDFFENYFNALSLIS